MKLLRYSNLTMLRLSSRCNKRFIYETTGGVVAVTVSVDQLGAEIRRRRDDEGLTLRDVEDRTGISAATLSRVERGSVPEVAVIAKLAEWLQVNVRAAGEDTTTINTDEDLKRTIAVHLRANKNLSNEVAHAIVEGFDLLMQLEIQRAQRTSGGIETK
jgi:transcriptional regulator with XRE-family HTH domain